MTVAANTLQTYTQVNIREDLSNAINIVDPYETPIYTMTRKVRGTQRNHEFNTDALASVNLNNALVEGDSPAATVLSPTVRLGNYMQTLYKLITISGFSQAVTAAGSTNTLGYQLRKKGLELRRDIEATLTNNSAKVIGNSTTASKMAGLPCWLGTNTVFQTGGAPSGANPTVLDGTATRTYNSVKAAMTEAQVKSVLQKIVVSTGSSPKYAIMSPANRQIFSSFSGPGTRFTSVKDGTLSTSVDVYQSDFGNVFVQHDIFLATSGDVYFINPQYLKIATLRPINIMPLAKTGDADTKMMLTDVTLEVSNEKAHGALYDTTG